MRPNSSGSRVPTTIDNDRARTHKVTPSFRSRDCDDGKNVAGYIIFLFLLTIYLLVIFFYFLLILF